LWTKKVLQIHQKKRTLKVILMEKKEKPSKVRFTQKSLSQLWMVKSPRTLPQSARKQSPRP